VLPNFEEDTNDDSNYPVVEDTAFTKDEIEAIKAYKDNLSKKLHKNSSVLKGLETSFWGIISYSIARFLILTSGSQGIGLAIAACFLINQITNRDLLDVSIERREGQLEINGMGKLIKFAFSTLVSVFIIWSALGNFLNVAENSKRTYDQLQNTVEEFNKLPDNQQDIILIIGGLVGLAGIYVIIDSMKKR
jgi:hypothetical protein